MGYDNDYYGGYDNDGYDRPRRRGNYGERRNNFRGGGRSNGYRSAPKKRTGCKQGQDKNGNMYMYGHRFLKRSVMIASAFKSKDGKGLNGKQRINVGVDKDTGAVKWERYLVSVQTGASIAAARASEPRVVGAFFYPAKGHIIIPDLGVMMKPSSNYFGTYKRTN